MSLHIANKDPMIIKIWSHGEDKGLEWFGNRSSQLNFTNSLKKNQHLLIPRLMSVTDYSVQSMEVAQFSLQPSRTLPGTSRRLIQTK